MDDFYLEMKDTLVDLKKESNTQSNLQPQDPGILASAFPNVFAEALVMPINPSHWPAYVTGSAAANSETQTIEEKLTTPIDNVIVAKEYLESSQSDIEYRDRVWKVAQDTTAINLACEIGGEVGSFVGGAASNKVAEGYFKEMYETSSSLGD